MITFKQQQLHEAGLSRIWQHAKEHNMAILTAYRGTRDEKENEMFNKQLAAEIRSSGLGYLPVTGFYIENPNTADEKRVIERSFIVVTLPGDHDRLKNFAIKMGKKFNQDSVFYKSAEKDIAVLIGTASGRWPGLDVEAPLGKFSPNKIGDYYTKMRGGRTFVFEAVEEPESPLMGRAARERLQKLDSGK